MTSTTQEWTLKNRARGINTLSSYVEGSILKSFSVKSQFIEKEYLMDYIAYDTGQLNILNFSANEHGQSLITAEDAHIQSEVEVELNKTKNILNEFNITEWKQHTSKTLLNASILNAARKLDLEFCTRAFLKLFEILSAYDIASVFRACKDEKVMTFHLCEAPGAFVTATNHYIKSKEIIGKEFDWRASTLNPWYEGNETHEMLNECAFINETKEKWIFGMDNTGNIRKRKNIEELWRSAKEQNKPVLLVTADGGVDDSTAPNDQEENGADLHFCEMVAALGLLHKNGTFVLKMFTLFRESSRCILYILSSLFESVRVCKPTMSTPGNGEIYVVAMGFRGINKILLEALIMNIVDCSDASGLHLKLPQTVDDDWLMKIHHTAKLFAELQTVVIKRNLFLYDSVIYSNLFEKQTCEHILREMNDIVKIRDNIAKLWMQRFKLKNITQELKITHKTLKCNMCQRTKRPTLNGDLYQRKQQHQDQHQEPEVETMKSVYGVGFNLLYRGSKNNEILQKINPSNVIKNRHGIGYNDFKHWILKSKKLVGTEFINKKWIKSGRNIYKINTSMFVNNELISQFTKTKQSPLPEQDIRDFICSKFDINVDNLKLMHLDYRQDELSDRRQFNTDMIHALKYLGVGDCYVRMVTSSFTRFTTALYYLLMFCFNSVKIISINGHGICLLGTNFVGRNDVVDCIVELLRCVAETNKNLDYRHEVLEILNSDILTEAAFLKDITRMNNAICN